MKPDARTLSNWQGAHGREGCGKAVVVLVLMKMIVNVMQ